MTQLEYCVDASSRSASMQMALDEVNMKTGTQPFIRHYRWARPSASIGYFTPLAESKAIGGSRDVVRRYTGGGLVDHLDDWTFSLTLPARLFQEVQLATKDWYCRIHRAVRDALGHEVYLKTNASNASPGPCFTAPVEFDGMLDGQKIFGGAIRKSRQGLLYQGSIQGITPADDLLVSIGKNLHFGELIARTPDEITLLEASKLAVSRYSNPEWLERF